MMVMVIATVTLTVMRKRKMTDMATDMERKRMMDTDMDMERKRMTDMAMVMVMMRRKLTKNLQLLPMM